MKRAVSVSLGSSRRDHCVEIELLGQWVRLERIGTDGDVQKATALFSALDGQVDALGVGGIDLTVGTDTRAYPLSAGQKLIQGVKRTPVVDGRGLKFTLERQCMHHVEAEIGDDLQPKQALVNVAADRYGMALGLVQAGYACVFGDLQFALGVPIPIRRLQTLNRVIMVLAPLAGRLPAHILYPTGEAQRHSVPRFTRWYRWATVIAGDCHYTMRHMPPRLPGKSIITNTTTPADVACFREAGVRYLITTTPRLEGRSFGTNVMEAALVAVAGKGRPLTYSELLDIIELLQLRPQIQRLDG